MPAVGRGGVRQCNSVGAVVVAPVMRVDVTRLLQLHRRRTCIVRRAEAADNCRRVIDL